MAGWHIGLIGEGAPDEAGLLEDAQEIPVGSAFGEPSGAVTMGRIGGVRVTMLARHGVGHRLPPSRVNYRANIDVLKRCGVTDVLAVSAVQSLRDDLSPGDAIAVDQFIDRTTGRERSFFDAGLAAHVDMAGPVCPRLTGFAADAVEAAGATVHRGECYVAIEGPQWPTCAETRLYRDWGGAVAGMTGLPEAALAREAELPYALVAVVAEPGSPAGGSVAAILRELAAALPETREDSPIDRALDRAVLTSPEHWDAQAVARLDAVAGRILRQGRPDWF